MLPFWVPVQDLEVGQCSAKPRGESGGGFGSALLGLCGCSEWQQGTPSFDPIPRKTADLGPSLRGNMACVDEESNVSCFVVDERQTVNEEPQWGFLHVKLHETVAAV
jgi:hypothetical protein